MNAHVPPVRFVTSWPTRPDGVPATLIAALARNAHESADRVAFRERDYGIWQERTWREVFAETLALAAAFQSIGLGPGQALTVIGDNRMRLYLSMIAATALRAFPSPVFPDVPPEELTHYTRYGEPRIAVAEDQEQVDKLLELRERTGRPHRIVYDDPRGLSGYPDDVIVSYDEMLLRGRALLAAKPALATDLVSHATAEDIAVLMHSSGTTGAPKGVPLRHRNVIGGVLNARAGGVIDEHEDYYAYLPAAWVGDFMFSLAAAVLLRFTVNIPERQETVLRDLREAAPTWYLAAPRAWDNMLTRVQVGIEDSTRAKRALFKYFVPRAIEIERRRLAGTPPSVVERLLMFAGEILVFGPVKDYLGVSLVRHAFTGGEAIGEDTFLFFRALGVNLRQIYGQTESCALTAAQADGAVTLHAIGNPLPGVEVRIDDKGEILIKSSSVIDGYFDDPEASGKALADGWLHTGDAGYFENGGDLVVLGRVSEVVHTAAGERYIPNYIENRIKFSPYIRNVAVLGAGRAGLCAIACIDHEAVGHWAEDEGISFASYAELSQRPQVYDLTASVLRHVNELLPQHLRVRRFVNLHKDFDADDGEITRTRKLRRNVIEERYASLIDALYSGARTVEQDARIVYESGETGTIRRTLSIREVG
ncbi:AMP-binding protein [Bradyrhizobium sp. LHD-71]|uniref:AMP-dependent synthetase/ligase n=1 Tax=Bradyrhizobium sp. LHD-71 TaxID=3072141 RepID=UPI00280C89EB|nr:AMP-binding protein [Bradyrhizobium sp. LHD-71]MDQ8727476.1 AMP-binding protein [Bradyrhizobium sp. LHD-71]